MNESWRTNSRKPVLFKGRALLQLVEWDMVALVSKLYPDHNWAAWKFSKVPPLYWKDIANQRKYFDTLGQELGIKTLDDWYNVPVDKIRSNGTFGGTFHATGRELAC
jgi:hypothetical protein